MKVSYKDLKIEVDENVMYDMEFLECYTSIVKAQKNKDNVEMLDLMSTLIKTMYTDTERKKIGKWIKKHNNGRLDMRAMTDIVTATINQVNALVDKKK